MVHTLHPNWFRKNPSTVWADKTDHLQYWSVIHLDIPLFLVRACCLDLWINIKYQFADISGPYIVLFKLSITAVSSCHPDNTEPRNQCCWFFCLPISVFVAAWSHYSLRNQGSFALWFVRTAGALIVITEAHKPTSSSVLALQKLCIGN